MHRLGSSIASGRIFPGLRPSPGRPHLSILSGSLLIFQDAASILRACFSGRSGGKTAIDDTTRRIYMLKLLRNLRRQEWAMAAVCAVLILGQIYFDLALPDYMSSLTVLINAGEHPVGHPAYRPGNAGLHPWQRGAVRHLRLSDCKWLPVQLFHPGGGVS